VARQNCVLRLVGQVLQENAGTLRLVKGLGFSTRPSPDPTVVEAVLELPASAAWKGKASWQGRPPNHVAVLAALMAVLLAFME
jgi:hypothetical protein